MKPLKLEDKLDTLSKRLLDWMEGRQAGPMMIELIPTNRCNSRCLTCWRDGGGSLTYEDEMTDRRLLRLIDEAAEVGVRHIAFVGGGEPTARGVTMTLCRKIKKHGMHGDLVTNGTILTERNAEMLVDIGWNMVKVSLDGPDAATHDYLRGVKGTFERVRRTFERFRRFKKQYDTHLPRMVINAVISKVNHDKFFDTVAFAVESGVEEILLLPMTVFHDTGSKMKMEAREISVFQEQIRQALEFIKKRGVSSNMAEFLDTRYVDKTNEMDEVLIEDAMKEMKARGISLDKTGKDPAENFITLPCFDPWHHMTIIANGNIGPCFNGFVWKTDTSIKDHALADLWFGEYFDKYRKSLITRKLPPECRTCCVWKVFENRKIRDRLSKLRAEGETSRGG